MSHLTGAIIHRHPIPAFMLGLVFGIALGLWARTLLTTGALDAFTCTEYSPVTGQCVVFTNQVERRRYD